MTSNRTCLLFQLDRNDRAEGATTRLRMDDVDDST